MDRNYRFPGGGTFVQKVAEEQGDGSLTGKINRLPPVMTALSLIANAATAHDQGSAQELLKRASEEVKTLQAGITAILYAQSKVAEVHGLQPGIADDHPVTRAALPPRPAQHREQPPQMQSTRPQPSTINSVPIDSAALGVAGSARPAGWVEGATTQARTMQEHYERGGVDEEMQGAPPRQDTGVNQSQNQLNINQTVDRPMHARSWKEGGNAPDPARDTPETFESYPIQGLRPQTMETYPNESPLDRMAKGEGPRDQEAPAPQPAPVIARTMIQPTPEAVESQSQGNPVEAATMPVAATTAQKLETAVPGATGSQESSQGSEGASGGQDRAAEAAEPTEQATPDRQSPPAEPDRQSPRQGPRRGR